LDAIAKRFAGIKVSGAVARVSGSFEVYVRNVSGGKRVLLFSKLKSGGFPGSSDLLIQRIGDYLSAGTLSDPATGSGKGSGGGGGGGGSKDGGKAGDGGGGCVVA